MDNFKNMSVKIKTVAKQLPKYSRATEEIIPFLDAWLEGQDERFIRKVKKIFEGAAVDKRYSIMDPESAARPEKTRRRSPRSTSVCDAGRTNDGG